MRITLKPSTPSSLSAEAPLSLFVSPLKIGFFCALFLHVFGYFLVSIPPLSLPSPFLFPQVEVSRVSPDWVLAPSQKALPVPVFAKPPKPTLDELFPFPVDTNQIFSAPKYLLFPIDPRDVLSFLPQSERHPRAIFIASGLLASVPIVEKPKIPTRSFSTKLPTPHFFSYSVKVDPTTGRPFWFAPLRGESNPWVEEQLKDFRFAPQFFPSVPEGVMEVTLYP